MVLQSQILQEKKDFLKELCVKFVIFENDSRGAVCNGASPI